MGPNGRLRLRVMLESLRSLLRGFAGVQSSTAQHAHLAADSATVAAGNSAICRLLLEDFAERSLLLQGNMAARAQPKGEIIADLASIEFRVTSQWGEDGIIEWLVQHLTPLDTRFVEFGVETFREAN